MNRAPNTPLGWRRLQGAAALMLALALFGCGGRNEPPAENSHEVVESDSVGALSLYDLPLKLTDQHGAARTLADLRGRPLVVAMIYTSCESVCPRITEDMKAVEASLPAEDLAGSDFVLFSLDPGRDTPQALEAFAKSHQLDQSRWRLFATDEAGVLDLAAVLGVKHRRAEDGEIAHSAIILIVDREGVVRYRQVGMGEDPAALIQALHAANS